VVPTQLLDEGDPHVLGEILGLRPVTAAEPEKVAVHVREVGPVEGAERVGRHHHLVRQRLTDLRCPSNERSPPKSSHATNLATNFKRLAHTASRRQEDHGPEMTSADEQRSQRPRPTRATTLAERHGAKGAQDQVAFLSQRLAVFLVGGSLRGLVGHAVLSLRAVARRSDR
jgi:hypothetical protein